METVHSCEGKEDNYQYKCLIRIVSKVSGQVGSSMEKYERKSVIVRFASIVIFAGTC
jgi:hypothetical protein